MKRRIVVSMKGVRDCKLMVFAGVGGWEDEFGEERGESVSGGRFDEMGIEKGDEGKEEGGMGRSGYGGCTGRRA